MLIILIILLIGLIWKLVHTVMDAFGSKVLYEQDSLYHHITVAQSGSLRYLRFDDSNQSAIDLDHPLRMVFPYTSYLHLGVVAHPQPTTALFIGLGGGSAPKKFLHDYPSLTAVDAVEIDPEVVKLARAYFQLPDDPRLRVITQDGRLFVEQTVRAIAAGRTTLYDLVMIDAYSSNTVPYHLTTLEFLQAVRKTLSPDGVVVSNIIGAFNGPHSRFFHSISRTFGAVFPQQYIFPVGGRPGDIHTYERNIILIATLNAQKWEKTVWQKRATYYHEKKLITENVPDFVQTLVDDHFLQTPAWLENVPVLTDGFAPDGTRQHPL